MREDFSAGNRSPIELRNALPDLRSVTLHVYAGEMDHCSLYVPCDGGGWAKTAHVLEYQN